MIKDIIQAIEKQKITIAGWTVGFIGIVLIRGILEAISNPSSSGIIASDLSTSVHYALFYVAAIIGLMCIVYTFTKWTNIYKLALYGLVITWLPPIVDTIFSLGKGLKMTYIFNNEHNIIKYFFTFFGPDIHTGATLGIRIEMIIIFIFIGLFVWSKTRKISLGIVSSIISYIYLFFLGSIPYFVYTGINFFSMKPLAYSVSSTIYNQIDNSLIPLNMLHGTLIAVSYTRFLELGFNVFMSQILFIISVGLLSTWFLMTKKDLFKIVIKNSRWERIGMYLSLVLMGAVFALVKNSNYLMSWVDYMGFVCLVISWYAACMFATHINDIEDVSIDSISNKDRPLVAKNISEGKMKDSAYIWLIISLVGSYIVGYIPFFMNVIFTASYYIYSAEPLRLKRIPFLSSFIISVACLSATLSGFFFLSLNKIFYTFPPLIAFGILVMFTLATNIRDIKDIEGDKANNIKTLPVMFGKKIVGLLFALSFLLAPIFLSFYTLYIISIPCAYFGYKLVTRSPYKEKYIFYLYFSFALSLSLLIGILYWFGKVTNNI